MGTRPNFRCCLGMSPTEGETSLSLSLPSPDQKRTEHENEHEYKNTKPELTASARDFGTKTQFLGFFL